jgi:uncharacterized protein
MRAIADWVRCHDSNGCPSSAQMGVESLVVRDLRIPAQSLGATVSHDRDGTGLEADAVVERRDGVWAAFEVKLGPGAVDDGARSLLRMG